MQNAAEERIWVHMGAYERIGAQRGAEGADGHRAVKRGPWGRGGAEGVEGRMWVQRCT